MNLITRFEIKNLHGNKNLDLKFSDNTLILVGENGAGKSTVLQLFYYLLSGQWGSMAKYQFESVSMTIEDKRHVLKYSDIEQSFRDLDHKFLGRLPPSPPRQNSCRPDKLDDLGAMMEERIGSIRTRI